MVATVTRPRKWTAPGVELYCGDSTEILKRLDLAAIGTVLTDPPYGDTHLAYDSRPALNWCELLSGWKGTCVSFASLRYLLKLIPAMPLPFRYEMVWVKNCATRPFDANRRPLSNHELLAVFGSTRYLRTDWPRARMTARVGNRVQSQRTNTNHWQQLPRTAYVYSETECPKTAFSCATDRSRSTAEHPHLHPSRKPVEICNWLVRTFAPPRSTVVDPFMGSGTTGLAAIAYGRKFIGIERDPTYFAMAKRRIQAFLRERAAA